MKKKKSNDRINGATFSPTEKKCYCEIGMKGRYVSGDWMSCILSDPQGYLFIVNTPFSNSKVKTSFQFTTCKRLSL